MNSLRITIFASLTTALVCVAATLLVLDRAGGARADSEACARAAFGGRVSCLRSEATAMRRAHGTAAALARLERLGRPDECHLVGHDLGVADAAAHSVLPSAGVTRHGLSQCEQGYLHGVELERVRAATTVGSLVALGRGSCGTPRRTSYLGGYDACIHGYGHAFVRLGGIDAAARGCAQLTPARARSGVREECLYGAFMEVALRAPPTTTSARMVAECERTAGTLATACWDYLPARLQFAAVAVREALTVCEQRAPVGAARAACLATAIRGEDPSACGALATERAKTTCADAARVDRALSRSGAA